MLASDDSSSNNITSHTPTSMVLLFSTHNMACSKTVYRDEEGRLCMSDYGNESIWNASVVSMATLDDVESMLDTASMRLGCTAIYGALIDESRSQGIKRRKEPPEEAICSTKRQWLPIDIDDVVVEADGRDARIERLIAEHLPAAFSGVSCVYQMTSSYLLKGDKSHLRCRLFFLLDEPVDTEVLRTYMRDNVTVADYSIYSANQPIYVEPPHFKDLRDPVGRRVGRIAGFMGDTVCVAQLDLAAAVALTQKQQHTFDMPDVEPDEVQVAEAIERVMSQEPKGARHPWMVGCCVELASLGTDADRIVNVCNELIRKEGREPGAGEAERALRFALTKLSSGTARVDRAPLSALLDTDEEAAAKLDAARAERATPAPPVTVEEEEGFDDALEGMSSGRSDVANAQAFVAGVFGEGSFICWSKDAYCWTGKGWRAMEDGELDSLLARHAPHLSTSKRAAIAISTRQYFAKQNLRIPCWLDDEGNPTNKHVGTMLNLANGMLDVDALLAGEKSPLLPHDKRLFSVTTLPFAYDQTATCPVFLRSMEQWFPEDSESQREIQKILGYMLTPDNDYQKFFFFAGESRAGKGCLCRVIREMIGPRNITSPSLRAFGGSFGLASLVGKSICMIPEANAQHRRDLPQESVDRLKMISGGDEVSVDRKYNTPLNLVLPTKIILTANQVPPFEDISSGLTNRLHLLNFKHSFYGREDVHLTTKLCAEIAGILNWAIAGLRHLLDDNGFRAVAAAKDLTDDIKRQSSPPRAFANDCLCSQSRTGIVPTNEAYAAFTSWCADQGFHRPATKIAFIRAIRNIYPHVDIVPSKGRDRPGHMLGVTLNDDGRAFAGIDTENWVDKQD